MVKIMNRSIGLNSEEVAELRLNKELSKVVALGSGYDYHDLLSVYCVKVADGHPSVTDLDVIVCEKIRVGTLFATSCYVLHLLVI